MPMSRPIGGTKMPASASNTTGSAIGDAAGVGRLEAGDAAQRRGLAAAGRAEQREELACRRHRSRCREMPPPAVARAIDLASDFAHAARRRTVEGQPIGN